jgi:hypothetical protein
MALTFGAVASDRVQLAHAASLADIAAGTYLSWIRPTGNTAFRRLYQKNNVASAAYRIFAHGNTPTAQIGFEVGRATVACQAYGNCANFAAYSLNAWTFCAARYDTAASNGDQELYVGNLTTPLAEPSAYAVQQVGSGTVTADAGSDPRVGNNAADTGALQGDMAFFGLWNRYLTYGEMLAQQWHPHPTEGCVVFLMLGWNGTSTQPDWSGNLNNGTVTGATVAAHVPLRALYGGFAGWRGAFTAATGNRRRRFFMAA